MATLGKTTITDLSVYNTIHGKVEQADKVTITSDSIDEWRNMLVTAGANDIFSVPNVYANYSLGALKAKTVYITGSASNTTALISSDTTDNMYFGVRGLIPLVIDTTSTTNPCLRTSNSLKGVVDLGTSTHTWRNVYANTFIGNLSGNASTASKININNSSSNNYFPLTFVSTITPGNQALYVSTGKSLTFNPNGGKLKFDTNTGIYYGDVSLLALSDTSSFTGHPNDGNSYAIIGSTNYNTIIRSAGNLIHYSGANGKRYNILDSNNYSNYALPLAGGTITGNLNILAENTDKYINFKYSTTDLDNLSWRIGYTGSLTDDNNKLVFQSNKTGAWVSALEFTLSGVATFTSSVTATSFIEGGTPLNEKYAAKTHSHAGYASSTHTHTQYAPTSHTHTQYAAASHTHTQYAPTSHTHTQYAAASHTHTEYAPSTHTHAYVASAGYSASAARATYSASAGYVATVRLYSTGGSTTLFYPMVFTTAASATTGASLYIDSSTGTTETSAGIRYNPYYNRCYCSGGFYEASDERLKNFGDNIEVDLDKLSQLSKKYFTWKDDESNERHVGVSAQELQELYPEIVNTIDEEGHLSVSYDKLSVIALKGIDVLNDKVKSLEERITKLEKLIDTK